MVFNIDVTIVVIFLLINLVVGLYYSRGVNTISEYALGNRNFNTSTIAATIIATWIGGGVLSQTIAETYKQGLYFIIPAIGDSLVLAVVGYFLAPRMVEFLGRLSIAEAMGNIFGAKVRLVCAMIGIASCIGVVAVQFKVCSTILKLFFDISSFYAVLASAIVVVLYSSFGGIRAVTFTDIVQFFTFATIIPIISLIIWGTLNDPHKVFLTISENPLFDYQQVFDFYNPKLLNSLLLFLFFVIPTLEPAIFQRIAMAKNISQITKSFVIASFACLAVSLTISWIGVLLLSDNPNLEPNNLLAHIIGTYSYTGLKGLIAIGIIAIVMSTADSYINSAAVIFTNDLCKPLGIKLVNNNALTLSRISAVCIGILAFFLAFNTQSILKITLLIWGSYMPIITTPLLLAIFGFRSSGRAVLIGMSAGLITLIIFKFYDLEMNSVIPAMLSNLVVYIGSHYLLKQPGGWVGITDDRSLADLRLRRKRKINHFIKSVKNFSFLQFCKNNSPKQDYVYTLFGLFCIISIFSTMYSISPETRVQHKQIIEFIYHTALVISAMFLCYPIWPPTFKQEKFIIVLWNISVPYMLVFAPTLLVIISNFGQFQLMVLMLNMIILAFLIRWYVAILLIAIGLVAAIKYYTHYIGFDAIPENVTNIQFKITYLLLLLGSILIAFIKPKQEQQELTEEKVEHLGIQVHDREEELEKSQELKYEFLRNLEHEVRTPITGITSMGQVLHDNYDKLNEKQRRQAIEEIAKSSQRLNSLTDNLLDLSKLSSLTYDLHKTKVNLSELVSDRLDHCKKLYLNNKELEFFIEVEPRIEINCDQHYITSTIDNLIINSIQYSNEGKIIIKLTKIATGVEFSIQDEGIGIPQNELHNVFGAFIVSSKTRTPAGGRGIGLALCEKAIKAHGGEISAESDGEKGAVFKFNLPTSRS